MEYKNLLYSSENGIATITLNRPKFYNALNTELVSELGQIMDEIAIDDSVRVVIITGNEKAFAAGADISNMAEYNSVQGKGFSEHFHHVYNKIEALQKPVIAAIAGLALGGGCELTLACDLRIAAENAKFGLPEINLGIIPGAGGTQRLPRAIGAAQAKMMIFTGEMIKAEEALRCGLVNCVVKPEELLGEARKIAAKLAEKPGIAIIAAKRAVNNGLNTDLHTGCTFETECIAGLFATEDQKEGMRAFIEKRKAQFKNR